MPITSLRPAPLPLLPSPTQPRQLLLSAEVVDAGEAFFDLFARNTGERHQGAVFRVDIGPVDAEDAGAVRHIHRAGDFAPTQGADRHRRALAIAVGVFGRRRPDANLVYEAVDHRVGDLLRARMRPAETSVGDAGGQEIGRAV